jgi:hypothetical protein
MRQKRPGSLPARRFVDGPPAVLQADPALLEADRVRQRRDVFRVVKSAWGRTTAAYWD